MRTLVTGATGFIGGALLERIACADELGDAAMLTRRPFTATGNVVRQYGWLPPNAPPAEAFEGARTVFHLAGEPIAAGRWTPQRKERIRASRVEGTRAMVGAISRLPKPPEVLVAASAVGYFGDRGDEELDESAAPANDFLGDICQQWETEARRAAEYGVRVVNVRIGLVLAADGGVLARMLVPFRMGVGGRIGSGRQWMSWIHIADLVDLLVRCAVDDKISGPVNAVAPEPVRNAEFTQTLARKLHRPAVLPVPAFALRLALGEMATLLLGSQRVYPRAAQRAGFQFQFPTLAPALEDLL